MDRLTTNSFTTCLEKGPEIQLSLGAYYLRSLPLELFQLDRLTVLIHREFSLASRNSRTQYCSGSNKPTHMPPRIKDLTNLQELDVSVNKLQCIPAEMLQMQLFPLNINVNPFLRNTSLIFIPLATRVGISKLELADKSVVPSLSERCSRVLRTYCRFRSRTKILDLIQRRPSIIGYAICSPHLGT